MSYTNPIPYPLFRYLCNHLTEAFIELENVDKLSTHIAIYQFAYAANLMYAMKAYLNNLELDCAMIECGEAGVSTLLSRAKNK